MAESVTSPVKNPATDPGILLRRIKEAFPEVSWGTYRYVDAGWDHEVLILDDKLVFRFPNDAEYTRLLRGEIAVLGRLKPLVSVGIPDYTYVAPDFSFAGYPMVPGTVLHADVLAALPPADRQDIIRQLAGFLSVMHGLIVEGHDFTSVMLSDMREYQEEMKQQVRQYLLPAVSAADFAIIQDILRETDKLLQQKLPLALLHGDVYHEHLLWDESSRHLGIIDFSDVNRGDPAFDFAELYEYGVSFVRDVYARYTGPKDDTFLQRAWTYQRWVGVFMMTDHFVYRKTSFQEARETFDRVKTLLQ